jgi:hypothetical protein
MIATGGRRSFQDQENMAPPIPHGRGVKAHCPKNRGEMKQEK